MSWIILECINTGNFKNLPRIVAYRRYHEDLFGVRWPKNGLLSLWPKEKKSLVVSGSCYRLQELIQRSLFDPHDVKGHLLLVYALQTKRYDMAYILLNNGTDVET